MIPVFRPKMNTEEILSELRIILNSGWIGLGPKTAEFEEKFAEYIGVKYAVGVNSATAALHLANHTLQLKSEDEVIVPAMTFVSTAVTVMHAGGKPVFCDVLPDTLCLDPEDIRRKITKNTKAIIPVHFGGHACPMDEIIEISNEFNLTIIEDVAHGCGGKYKDKMLGSVGSMGCFSFHAVKNLPTGDGGMITTNDEDTYKQLKELRWVGINKDTWERDTGGYSWQYSVDKIGFKCHMNDITAVIGLSQLKSLDEHNMRRREIAETYSRELNSEDWLDIPTNKDYAESANHNYVIKTHLRNDLNKYLSSKEISTGVHYEPINHYGVFDGIRADVPVTESSWESILSLPIYPDLNDEDLNKVISEIKEFGKRNTP